MIGPTVKFHFDRDVLTNENIIIFCFRDLHLGIGRVRELDDVCAIII